MAVNRRDEMDLADHFPYLYPGLGDVLHREAS
jgi:hypothetical protein